MKKLMVLLMLFALVACSNEYKAKHAVEKYVKENLQDPDSYQSVWYSDINVLKDSLGNNIGWIVVHIYREKNTNGGYEEFHETYTLDQNFDVDPSLVSKL